MYVVMRYNQVCVVNESVIKKLYCNFKDYDLGDHGVAGISHLEGSEQRQVVAVGPGGKFPPKHGGRSLLMRLRWQKDFA